MRATDQTRPDTHDMVVVHRLFRREFRLTPDLISRVAEGDTTRAKELAEHAGDLVFVLHHHHAAEDEVLWPALLQATTLHADLVHRMEAQHGQLSAILDEIDGLLPAWAAEARTADRDRLVDALRRAAVVLDEHLAEEEREILPLVRQHLTVADWRALGKRGAKVLKNSKKLIFMGMVLEDASAKEADDLLGPLPPPVRWLWRFVGRRQYAAYIARIRA